MRQEGRNVPLEHLSQRLCSEFQGCNRLFELVSNVSKQIPTTTLYSLLTDEDNHERKQHSGEKERILCFLVKYWRLLEDAQSSSSSGQQIEELQNDEVDEVD